MEEIVGEIGDEYDEYDEYDDPTPPTTTGSSRIPAHQSVDGLLIIEDFDAVTGITLPDGPYETVACFLLHQLQRVPQLGDSIDFGGHRLTVSALDGPATPTDEAGPVRAASAPPLGIPGAHAVAGFGRSGGGG